MKGPPPGTLAYQGVDRGYVRVMYQSIGVKSSPQKIESVRVRLERIKTPAILHPRSRSRRVKSEIRTNIENHRILFQKTPEHRKNICLHVPTKEVVGGIKRIRVDADVFAGGEAHQSSVSARGDWPVHV